MASTGIRAHPGRFLPPDPRVEEPYRVTPGLALRIGILGFVALALFALAARKKLEAEPAPGGREARELVPAA